LFVLLSAQLLMSSLKSISATIPSRHTWRPCPFPSTFRLTFLLEDLLIGCHIRPLGIWKFVLNVDRGANCFCPHVGLNQHWASSVLEGSVLPFNSSVANTAIQVQVIEFAYKGGHISLHLLFRLRLQEINKLRDVIRSKKWGMTCRYTGPESISKRIRNGGWRVALHFSFFASPWVTFALVWVV